MRLLLRVNLLLTMRASRCERHCSNWVAFLMQSHHYFRAR